MQAGMKRPGEAEAFTALRNHLVLLGAWVVAIRAVPYVLHAMQK